MLSPTPQAIAAIYTKNMNDISNVTMYVVVCTMYNHSLEETSTLKYLHQYIMAC